MTHIKADDVYKDIANNVAKKFAASNYELERSLPKGKNKKVIGLMMNELDENVISEFLGLTLSHSQDIRLDLKKFN